MPQMSQKQRILEYLQAGNSITTYESFIQFGCTKLANRMMEIIEDGWNIIKEPVTVNDKRVMKYSLKPPLLKEGEIALSKDGPVLVKITNGRFIIGIGPDGCEWKGEVWYLKKVKTELV